MDFKPGLDWNPLTPLSHPIPRVNDVCRNRTEKQLYMLRIHPPLINLMHEAIYYQFSKTLKPVHNALIPPSASTPHLGVDKL